ncbi:MULTISPECIES: hypothetical protein [unclassified Schlesneria]|uniref:hypothetical protein n=1 Tax=unclassified Schlesneria TaxID=2762017 RepID=UPI002F10D82C
MSEPSQSRQPITVDYFSPWERRLEKHGWPTLLLILVGLFLWRFSDWFQPKIDEAINAHFRFMEAVKSTQEQQAINGHELATQQTRISQILDRQERRDEEMADRIKDVHKAVMNPK